MPRARRSAVRSPTPPELRSPVPPGFEQVATAWARREADVILALVWAGCDRLHVEYLSQVSWGQPMEDVERSINLWLTLCISEELTGFEPFRVAHGPPEVLTR